MAKLTVGEKMPNFTYDTPYEQNLTLAETAGKAPKTALVFLRYYGCPICQLDIQELADSYAEITAKGGQLLVVLQSKPELLAEKLGSKDALPYPIICDPEMKLYKDFCIEPAASMAKMADAKVMLKIAKATAKGYKHGEYEGEELQLPAAFVVNSDCEILYAHYAKSLGDMPSSDDLAELLA